MSPARENTPFRSAERPPVLARARAPCAALASLLLAGAAGAQTIDLVDHNSFEACWSQSVSAAQFQTLLATTMEGAAACIPPAADGSSCATSTCTGGAPGCAVTLRAGQYGVHAIDLASGIVQVDASSGFDPFSMPVVLPVVGACTLNVTNTAGVVLQYPLYYGTQADGNGGAYAFSLTLGSAVLSGLTTSDVSLSGSIGCSVANVGLSFFAGTIGSGLAAAIPGVLQPATVGETICPVP